MASASQSAMAPLLGSLSRLYCAKGRPEDYQLFAKECSFEDPTLIATGRKQTVNVFKLIENVVTDAETLSQEAHEIDFAKVPVVVPNADRASRLLHITQRQKYILKAGHYPLKIEHEIYMAVDANNQIVGMVDRWDGSVTQNVADRLGAAGRLFRRGNGAALAWLKQKLPS